MLNRKSCYFQYYHYDSESKFTSQCEYCSSSIRSYMCRYECNFYSHSNQWWNYTNLSMAKRWS